MNLRKALPVIPRQKPADYVETEDDVLSYVALEKRVAELEKNAGGNSEETDPTVPDWAKQPEKPTYTATEVGAMPKDTKIPTKTSELENDSGFLTKHQDISGKLDADKLPEAINTALAQAAESSEFKGDKGDPGEQGSKGDKGDKGDTGKTAYEYAKDGGYTGSESEFAAKLAADMVSITYDPDTKTLNISSGSGG